MNDTTTRSGEPALPLPLTPTQQGMLFHHQWDASAGVDIEQIVVTLDEALDVPAFLSAWQATVQRLDALRTRFVWRDVDEPQQIVESGVPLTLTEEDWRGPGDVDARLQSWLDADRRRGVDLAVAPPWRVALLRTAERAWTCVWTVHHIACDGRSFALVLGEVFHRYDAQRGGHAYTPPARPPFAAHVRQVSAQDVPGAEAFWRERLAGIERPTPLPGAGTPMPDAAAQNRSRGRVRGALDAVPADALRQLVTDHGLSFNTLVQAAWAVVLERFGGGSDVLFGATRHGRGSADADAHSIVGCLINTLPVRVPIDGGVSVVDFLRALRERERQVRPFEQTPLLAVQGWSSLRGDGGAGRQLFDSLLVVDHRTLDGQMKALGPAFATRHFRLVEQTHYPLTLYAWGEPQPAFELAYDEPRFDAGLGRRLLGGLLRVLEGMAADPSAPVDTLSVLTHADEQALRQTWNDTAREVPPHCIHQAFEAQAARTPQAVALLHGDVSIDYAALNQRANRLAHHLLRLGVAPGVPVGVCVSRGIDLVMALLAVLKAGGAYLPLDPTYPRERTHGQLADAAAPVLVTQRRHGALAAGRSLHVVFLDEPAAWAGLSADDPRTAVTPADLAYVMYTSGSTGRPKGTLVEHRNVVNFFAGMDDVLSPPLQAGDTQRTWLAVTSPAFDISVLELLWTLCRGWRVVLQGEQTRGSVSAPPRPNAHRAIDFSLMFFSSARTAGPEKYRLLLEGAKFADAHGFAAVWTPERHFHDFGGLFPNPSVTSAALAAVTQRIALRSGSVVAALHHPARIAEEWAVVDNLSGGRVGLSFAAGWQPRDFVLAPLGLETARRSLLGTVDQVRRLWRGEAVTVDGAMGRPQEIRTYPRPLQRELPVWLTAAGSPQTFREAGQIGAGVLTHLLGQTHEELAEKIAAYRAAWRAAGHAGQGQVTLMLHAFVGDDTAQVRETVRAPMIDYLRSSLALVKGYASAWTAYKKGADGVAHGTDVDIESLSPEDQDGLLSYAFERYFDSSGLFGDEQRVLDQVDRLKALGVDEVACLVDFGVDEERVLAHLQHLARVREQAQPVPAGTDEPLAQTIVRHGVTHLQCTPSLAGLQTHDPAALAALAGLDTLLLGGEALPPALAATLRRAGVKRLLNMYGPTETTIWSSLHEVTDADVDGGRSVPIGRPIANTTLHVLDARGRLVPPGVTGELCIGGAGVVRGYHERPELTAERFVPDPFAGGDARLYRTGDLVRRRDDGVLEYVGRADHQVKVRGHRIELGEIEAALTAHPAVREAVVAAREDAAGDVQLVAYVIAAAGQGGDVPALSSTLRAALRQRLPEAMVPAYIVPLAQWPLTPNGKIDRRALPAPQPPGPVASATLEAPAVADGAAGEVEQRIASVWQQVLNLPSVGLDANFFDLGGHSLLAVKAHRRIVEALNAPTMSITDLFRFPTIRSLAAHLARPSATAAAQSAAGATRAVQRRDALAARRGARPQRPTL